MGRPMGLISEDAKPDDLLVGSLIGAGPKQCDRSWLVDFFRFDLDQWPNSTCVQFSMANAVWAAQGIAGVAPADRLLISPPALYYATLRRTLGAAAVLEDLGSKPSECVATLNEVGCCLWDDWPHDPVNPAKCLTEPPGDLLMLGTDLDWVNLYRLDGYNETRKQQIIGCFCADVPKPVLCGIAVDKAYEQLKDQPWPGRTGAKEGRHMIALCGHNEIGPFVATSWGPGWAVGGLGQITWDAVLSLETTDIIALDVNLAKMPKWATQ